MSNDAIVPDGTEPNASTDSKDGTCEYCGAFVPYPGKGPRPRFCDAHKRKSSRNGDDTSERPQTANPPAVGGDVGAACAALSTLYDLVSAGLYFASPQAASEWAQRTPALIAQDQRILRADPALAKRLASVGSKGGVFALITVHVAAIAPVAGVLYQDRIAPRVAENKQAQEQVYTTPVAVPSQPPTADFFGMGNDTTEDDTPLDIPIQAQRFFG